MKWAAVLCLIHCLALPLFAALVGITDCHRFHGGAWFWPEFGLISVALVVSGIQVFRAFRRKKLVLASLGGMTVVAVIAALCAGSHIALVVTMLCTAAFQIVASRRLKKKCSCPHPH